MIADYRYKNNPKFRDSEREAYLKDREYWDSYQGNDYVDKVRSDITEPEQRATSRGALDEMFSETPERNDDTVGMFEGKNQRDHIDLFGKYIQPTLKKMGIESEKEQMALLNKFFVAPYELKVKMLQELSNAPPDDALWGSEEFLRIKGRANRAVESGFGPRPRAEVEHGIVGRRATWDEIEKHGRH